MATYHYRIGKFAYRRKGAVLSVWLIILVLMGVGAATLSAPPRIRSPFRVRRRSRRRT